MPVSKQHEKRYRFGPYTLDTDRGALYRDAQELRLRPQSFDVLNFLVERHGRLVTKEELQGAVWGQKVVTDDSLAHCLIDIRKSLGDADRKMLRTVPRRGYIFEADVVVDNDFSPPVSTATRFRLGVSGSVVAMGIAVSAVLLWWQFNSEDWRNPAPSSRPSIAVLPFIDRSADQGQQYIGDGLAEDILNSLGQLADLRVIARTSSFSFTGENPDVATIRNTLDVAFVLEGSVRSAGERLRITAQLISTADSSMIWSSTFERHPNELVAVQREITLSVVQSLLPNSDQSAVASAQQDVSANEDLFLARYLELEMRADPEVDQELLARVIELYGRATVTDPDSALAHSRLAGALLYQGNLGAAERPISRALELDSELSEVQVTLGNYYWAKGLPGAGEAWEKAVELNPNNADALHSLGYWIWMQGYTEKPHELFRAALDLDPLSLFRYGAMGNYYAHEARADEALEIIDRIKELFDDPAAYLLIARVMELLGRVDESIAWTIKARDLDVGDTDYTGALAELYADLGDIETAEILEPEPGIGLLLRTRRYTDVIRDAELLMKTMPSDIHLRYVLAFAYNAIGLSADAVRVLEVTGLPETVMPKSRQAIDMEAFVTLFDALDATGDVQRSRKLATWWLNRQHTDSANWWIHIYLACPLALLGRDEEALEQLEIVAVSPRLPWDFLVKDSRCLQRYAEEPRYQDVLAKIEARRSELRVQLPGTLAEYGVEL